MWAKDCYILISGHEISLSSRANFQNSLQQITSTSFCPNLTNTKEGILYAQNIHREIIQFCLHRMWEFKETNTSLLPTFFGRRGFVVLGIWFPFKLAWSKRRVPPLNVRAVNWSCLDYRRYVKASYIWNTVTLFRLTTKSGIFSN